MAKLDLKPHTRVSGILLDLGYSTAQVRIYIIITRQIFDFIFQINDPKYGLSYFRNQNLDMRLDLSDKTSPTALQILNWSSESELEAIFRTVRYFFLFFSFFYVSSLET